MGGPNWPQNVAKITKRTTCDECGTRVTLDTVDADGVLIGGECLKCGYYVTRYMPGQRPV